METSKINKINLFKSSTKGKTDYAISFLETDGEFRVFHLEDIPKLVENVFLHKWASQIATKTKRHMVIDFTPPANAIVYASNKSLGLLCPLTENEIMEFCDIFEKGPSEGMRGLLEG